jgi:DNA invertase Pin-like site-specific DNA recombinase
MMNKHITVYARVSSRSQDTASQEPDLKRWAEEQNSPVVWFRASSPASRWTGRVGTS